MKLPLSSLLCAFLIALAASASAKPALEAADSAWQQRAEGHRAERAAQEPIERAISLYEQAWNENPGDAEIGWRWLRALFFRAEYAAADGPDEAAAYAAGRDASEAVIDALAEEVGGRARLDDLEIEQAAEAFAGREAVGRIYFWAAVHWGGWARSHGLVRVLLDGLAPRLYRYTRLSVALAPTYDEGGPWRMLARLHARVPRVPFYTGWVDPEQVLPNLRRALEIAPDDPGNLLLYGLTLAEQGPDRRDEAVATLQRVARLEPRPDQRVEDLKLAASAREALRDLGADVDG